MATTGRDREREREYLSAERPADLDAPPAGTEFDVQFPLFESFDGSSVFDYGEWETRDFLDMLARDGKARTLEAVLSLPLRMTPWSIEPPSSGDRGQTEFVTDVLSTPSNAGGMSTSMTDVIGQLTAAIVNRKSFFEKVYRPDGGRVRLDKVAWRPPQTCRLLRDKRTGSFRGFEQDRPGLDQGTGGASGGSSLDPVLIKPHRALVYIHGKHRDPLRGSSDLEVAYWCHKTKQKVRFLWYQFLERQSMPIVLVKGVDKVAAQATARLLAGVKASGTMGVSKSDEFQVLESNGRGQDQFLAALRYLDSEMAGSVLAGFTDLTSAASEGRGSFALSKDQSDLFLQSRNAVAREIAACLDNYLISDLVWWNYGPNVPAPRFVFAPIGQAELEPVLQLMQTFGAASNLQVPHAFIDELVTRTATLLDLDAGKIRDAITLEQAQLEAQAGSEQAASLAPVVAASNVAYRHVKAIEAKPTGPAQATLF